MLGSLRIIVFSLLQDTFWPDHKQSIAREGDGEPEENHNLQSQSSKGKCCECENDMFGMPVCLFHVLQLTDDTGYEWLFKMGWASI